MHTKFSVENQSVQLYVNSWNPKTIVQARSWMRNDIFKYKQDLRVSRDIVFLTKDFSSQDIYIQMRIKFCNLKAFAEMFFFLVLAGVLICF